MVRRQVQSKAAEGIVSILLFKARGPYNGNSDQIQKIPAIQGQGRPGKIRKEAAMRLEKLPSTVVVYISMWMGSILD
jgi:hypothetical protein